MSVLTSAAMYTYQILGMSQPNSTSTTTRKWIDQIKSAAALYKYFILRLIYELLELRTSKADKFLRPGEFFVLSYEVLLVTYILLFEHSSLSIKFSRITSLS